MPKKDQSFIREKLTMNKYMIPDFWLGALASLLGAMTSFLWPIKNFILFIIVLILFDLYSGTRAAIKRKEVLSSKGYARSVEKFSLYSIGILSGYGMEIVFELVLPVTYVCAFLIALSEVKSIFENIETVTGIPLWKTLKSKLTINK